MIFETLDAESKKHIQKQLDYFFAAEPDEQQRFLYITDQVMSHPERYDERIVWLAMAVYERLSLWMSEHETPGAGHA